MKNNKKILIILLNFLIIIAIMPTVNATFDANDYEPEPLNNGAKIIDIGERIIGIIQVVGIIVSVGVLMAIGIKYMVGSVEEKASYKKSMTPYIIGAIMLFAASAFVQLLYDVGMSLSNTI